ncbi:MAG: WXG100 family type VII secretion target [Mycolicibacterium sp.]|uniref:hypothetical protein n=1 Tax=Mycolicibacterium sp. TaxID=2320850 RepID=UPI003D1440BA
MRVDPGALLAIAARIDAIRTAIEPGALPVGYDPPGADAGSAARATAVSAGAAAAANGLWASWSALGRVADTLRANAQGYSQRDDASAAMLSGGSASAPTVGAPVSGQPAPVAVPHIHSAAPAGSAEMLAEQLRAGAGASSPEQFAQTWRSHAGQVSAAVADLASVRSSLSSEWDGDAHDGAQADMAVVHADLSAHQDKMQRISGHADTHGMDYREVDNTVPTPDQFRQWHNNLQTAVAANNAYPGMYTEAVVQAQQDLAGGQITTDQAYGQYTVDPATGDLVDPVTGEHIDPVTGEPVDDDGYADDATDGSREDMLSSMGPQLLTGLLGGAVGAAGGAIGAVVQGGQQLAQMATQGVSQLAKSVSQQSGDLGQGDGLGDDMGLGSGDYGGSGSGGGGGGGDVPAAPMMASAPGPAPSAPSSGSAGGFGPTTRLGAAPAGGGMGMGAPMMPMGGGGAPAAADSSKAGASGDGKKFAPAQKANTQKVIGQADTERIASKREARERRLDDAKAKALAANEEAHKS